MQIAGSFRTARRKDSFFSDHFPKSMHPLTSKTCPLDVRIVRWDRSDTPVLLVVAPRRSGNAVVRNKFRRRVRMAFLDVLRKRPAVMGRGFFIWVRPAKGYLKGCVVNYRDIVEHLELSLDRLRPT